MSTCEVKRIAIRKRKANGQWAIVVLISTLTPRIWANWTTERTLLPLIRRLSFWHRLASMINAGRCCDLVQRRQAGAGAFSPQQEAL